MIYDEIALWGLTDQSSEQEIWDQIFAIFRRMGGRVSIATVKDGKPQTRIISLQRKRKGDVGLSATVAGDVAGRLLDAQVVGRREAQEHLAEGKDAHGGSFLAGTVVPTIPR